VSNNPTMYLMSWKIYKIFNHSENINLSIYMYV
jgi:hypothetical protein